MFSSIEIRDAHLVKRNEYHFNLMNTHYSLANAIRRTILADIPCVGFREGELHSGVNSTINIIENNGCLHNEFIKHRFSLIPVNIQPEEFVEDKYKFLLNVINNEHIYSKDITTEHITGQEKMENGELVDIPKSKMEQLFPANPITGDYVLITKLRERDPPESLTIELKPVIGTAKEHAGFSPVCKCSYSNVLDDAKIHLAREELQRTTADSELEIAMNDFNVHGKYRHYHVNPATNEADQFHFEIESIGIIHPHKLVTTALQILIDRTSNVRTNLKLNNKLGIEFSIPKLDNMYAIDLRIPNYCHTYGNLFQTYLYETCYEKTKKFTFVGYMKPHPLDNAIVLRVVLPDNIDLSFNEYLERVFAILRGELNDLEQHLIMLKNQWVTTTTTASDMAEQHPVADVAKKQKKVLIKKK